MIKSMTGYGKAALVKNEYVIKAEVRSLNSKYMDVNLRLPSLLRDKEYFIRGLLNEKIIRGKVDFLITVEFTAGEGAYSLNKEMVKHYYSSVKEVVKELGETNVDILSSVLKLQDVFTAPAEDKTEQIWKDAGTVMNEALAAFDKFRVQEGEKLEEEFKKLIASIKAYLEKATALEPERITATREKLNGMINEYGVKEKIDMNRFEQELIYYLERMDFTEERVRLLNHCDYFLRTMKEEHTNGRKLSFIGQEMGREINTLGAKAYHSVIQQQVVMMKDELEKIKEQLMNVL